MESATKKLPKIGAVYSVPRLCFTDNMFCAMAAFPALGIDISRHSGAFWEQSITKAINKEIARGCDFIITVDYDSVFDPYDVKELVRLMMQSDADFIFPMQMKRECNHVLMSIPQTGKIVNGLPAINIEAELTESQTGHFGLTIIRTASLLKVPRPWFWGFPNQTTGEWEEGKCDPDIGFWLAAKQAGLKAYMANRVKIGHIQRMVSWPGEDWQPVHQYLEDYTKDGPPKGVHPHVDTILAQRKEAQAQTPVPSAEQSSAA